ncbi:hypothetical protein PR048_011473 [Dryococelus australis]|uniref:Uncharacterized protein n=1 Tax=Dryococelus australis TaxID=614101 RepID=A0ABQ9HMF4_9NEOP|nr:hypothetical protein PR048_011473 [Dryococelus australis]
MDYRKRFSGAKYRKLAKEKKRKEDEALSQTPKLYTLFCNNTTKTEANSSLSTTENGVNEHNSKEKLCECTPCLSSDSSLPDITSGNESLVDVVNVELKENKELKPDDDLIIGK